MELKAIPARETSGVRPYFKSHTQPFIQPKLTINNPNDQYEQEADAMAEKVMRMEAPGLQLKPLPVARIQRACAACAEEEKKEVQRKCAHCEEEEKQQVQLKSRADKGQTLQKKCAHCEEEEKQAQRKEINQSETASPDLDTYVSSIHGGGQSLPTEVRNYYEPRFGYDFSNVRVHTDATASKSAQSINSLAYTTGSNIVFNNGQYSPSTDSGKRLLGHELTHVVQQGQGLSPKRVQRLGDLTKVPPMSCDVANTSPPAAALTSLFPTSATDLSATQRTDIQAFVTSSRASGTNGPFRVDGYASTLGTDEVNWNLSCQRALSVANEIRNQGVPDTLITFFAQGETSEFGAQGNNQRADISVLGVPVPPSPPPCANPGSLRTLDLQPVFLRTDAADAAPTGGTWRARFNDSNSIWGKVGVTFVELSPITIDTPLKTSGATAAERTSIRALRSASGIEIYLVDNNLTTVGGADTLPAIGAGCGASGNIVLSDRGSSTTILAHELGHVLGLDHPSQGPPFNPGDASTIMEPSGSNSTPNPTRNTLVNHARILCPAPIGTTCLHPDP